MALLDALVDICGPDYARAGRSVDVVGGHRAGLVAVPATTQAVSDVLHLAAAQSLRVVARGSGSKIDWGTPSSGVDLILDTGRLNGLWSHDVSAATVEVATGTPVRSLQAALALRGQRVPVDPPSRTATLGGMLALNESGPLRYRYRTPAEHVDRVSYIDWAGDAGYSDGEGNSPGLAEITGVITSAVLSLQPLPQSRRWVVAPASTPLQAAKLATEAAQFGVSAIETDLPDDGDGVVAALFEDTDPYPLATSWNATVSPTAPSWWGRYPFTPTDVALRISVAPDDLAATVYALADAAGGPVPVRGSAGLGTVHAVLPGTIPADQITRILDAVRHVLIARNGHANVVTAPIALARQIEMATPHEFF
ncbi:FAD-binding oxidoreductase [Actinoplanes sp. CA-142083]|uniref:FAD-binding oxidoreductase n=1 Tax=Actinoplanes sp. CA-142083 TaxID=3239903 RepID=UPI003D8B6FAE